MLENHVPWKGPNLANLHVTSDVPWKPTGTEWRPHGHVGCWLPTKIHADCLAVAYPLLLPFWLRHVLRATAAYNFWSLSWPDVSAPATLASPLFECPEPQNIGKKHGASRLFYLFARLDLLSSDPFSSDFFLLLFSSLTALTSAFPSVHIVGSLTSKLPSPISTTYPCLEDHWDWECFNCWGCNIVTLWETDDWIWLGPPCLYNFIYIPYWWYCIAKLTHNRSYLPL